MDYSCFFPSFLSEFVTSFGSVMYAIDDLFEVMLQILAEVYSAVDERTSENINCRNMAVGVGGLLPYPPSCTLAVYTRRWMGKVFGCPSFCNYPLWFTVDGEDWS